MSALNSVIDCLTIDIDIWVRTLWGLARNLIEAEAPEPLRIVIPGAESAFRIEPAMLGFPRHTR